MGVAVLDQRNYILGDDDNADPDSCTWDGENAPRASQALNTNVMVRLQVAEDAGNATGNKNWQLYVNSVNDPDTATQVTTTSTPVQIFGGTPADQAAVDDPNVMTGQAETWQNGLFTDASDQSGKLTLAANFYTEFQFCVRFLTGASGDYYFFLFYNMAKLNGTYNNVAKVTIAAAAAPVGPIEIEFIAYLPVQRGLLTTWGKYW